MKMFTAGVFLLWASVSASPRDIRSGDVVVVVLSQGDSYSSRLAQQLRTDLQQQEAALGQKGLTVRLAHEELPHPGAWTVIPVIPKLQKMDGSNSSWIIFCEERTRFNLPLLLSALSQYDHTKDIWIGHGLHDREPTIIHHFAFAENPTEFKYPLLPAGFAMSSALLNRLAVDSVSMKKSDFSIDAMHELSVFVKTALTNLPSTFCLENQTECATYPLPFLPCGDAVPNEDIFFAVKTCLKHHADRVPVVQQTWGQDAANIEFFSDVQDGSIPTTAVGVANTERGHCAKTLAILRLALEWPRQHHMRWLVLADDDTLLSVPRLQLLLSCWRDEGVVVGERYGYNVHSPMGYNYPTGGGGIAINMAVLPTLANECHCLADDSPDDMYLGFCLARLGIPLVHSPFFHQARPADYAADYLATQLPVSFHKHWMLDPLLTYSQWLHTQPASPTAHLHQEL